MTRAAGCLCTVRGGWGWGAGWPAVLHIYYYRYYERASVVKVAGGGGEGRVGVVKVGLGVVSEATVCV